MKKFIYAALLTGITYVSLADAKKEIENFVKKDVSSKEFQQADKLITTLQEQGKELSEQGKYDEAMQCYQKALAQADKLYGKESTAAALVYLSMSFLFLKQGEDLKAADYFVKSSEIYEKSMGEMVRPGACRYTLMRAGFIYFESNNYRMAYQTLEHAQSYIEFFSEKDKKEYLPKLNEYLGIAYLKEREYKNAIPYLQKSIEHENKQLFPSKIKLSEYHLFLGEAMLETGNIKNVLKDLKESKKLAPWNSGADFDYYLSRIFARTYKYLNCNEDYLEYAKQALKASDKFADDDSRKAIAKIIWADANYKNGFIDDGNKILQNAISSAKKNSINVKIIDRMNNLQKLWLVKSKNSEKGEVAYWQGRVCFDEDRLDDAFASLKQALKLEEQKSKKSLQLLSEINFWLGEISYQFGEWKKSIKFLDAALLCTKKYDFDSDFYIKLAETLSAAYLMDKNYKAGLKYALEAYREYKKKYGNKTIKAGVHLSGIGFLYYKLGQKDKAIASFEEALIILEKYRDKNPYPFNRAKKHLEKLR